jgi:hypothetical protein
MKNRLWIPLALALFSIPFAAEAQFPPTPKSRPNVAPQVTQAEIQAPPVINVAPPAVNVAPPNVTVTPQLVAPIPSWGDEIKTWLNTIFGGGIFAALTTMLFRKSGTPLAPSAVVDHGKVVVADILGKLNDPAVQQTLKSHGLEIAIAAVQNPLVNTGAQAGLAVVGLGAAEPLIRRLGLKVLEDLAAKNLAQGG